MKNGRVVKTIVVREDVIFTEGEKVRYDKFSEGTLLRCFLSKILGNSDFFRDAFTKTFVEERVKGFSADRFFSVEKGIRRRGRQKYCTSGWYGTSDEDEVAGKWSFRELVGSLVWLSTQTPAGHLERS